MSGTRQRSASQETDLRAMVAPIKELPTLPQIVVTIMRIVDDPKSSAHDVNRIMSQDPALGGKILRLVNSAYYGLPKRVSSLGHAIVILGFNTVKSVALSASIFDLFRDTGKQGHLDKKGFWRHSIACACVARHLARTIGRVEPETAFSTGLLHDIGKLILDQYARPILRQVLERAESGRLLFIEAEREILATDHAEIGSWLMREWNFPPELVETIRTHHPVNGEIPTPLSALVMIANYFCERHHIGSGGNFREPAPPESAYAVLKITPDQMMQLETALVSDIQDAEEFMNLAAK